MVATSQPAVLEQCHQPTVLLSVKGNNQLFDRNKGQLNRKSTSSGQMVTESSFTPPLSKNRLKRHFLLPSNSPEEGINLFSSVIPLLPDTHTFQSTKALCLWGFTSKEQVGWFILCNDYAFLHAHCPFLCYCKKLANCNHTMTATTKVC